MKKWMCWSGVAMVCICGAYFGWGMWVHLSAGTFVAPGAVPSILVSGETISNVETSGDTAAVNSIGTPSESDVAMAEGGDESGVQSNPSPRGERGFQEGLQTLHEEKLVQNRDLLDPVIAFQKQMEVLRREGVLQPWSRDIVISRLVGEPSFEYEDLKTLIHEGDTPELRQRAASFRSLEEGKYVAIILELQSAVLEEDSARVYSVGGEIAQLMQDLPYPHLREIFTTFLTELQAHAQQTLEQDAVEMQALFRIYSRYVSRMLICTANDGLI